MYRDIPEDLRVLVEPIVEDSGLELVDVLISLLVPHKSIAEDGFASMFNGVDLTGWGLTNTPPETWSLERERSAS